MSITIKLENCEEVFNQKQILLQQLKNIENDIHQQYAIIQNDVSISGEAVVDFDILTINLKYDIADFVSKWRIHTDAISAHIGKCAMGKVSE